MIKSSLERLFFVVSLAVLALLYGYGAKTFGWFPVEYVDRAVRQAQQVLSDPMYLYPRVHRRSGAYTSAPAEVQPGLTLVATRWKGIEWDPGLKLIDREGNTVHDWHVDPAWFLEEGGRRRAAGSLRRVGERPLHGIYLFANGDVLVNLDYVGTARLDACGQVEWLLTDGNHHSIARTDDGSFWIPGITRRVRMTTPTHPDGFPGLKRPVFLDQILHVSPEGEVIDSLNVLDILYANELERHIFKSRMTDTTDVTHLNDVEPLSASLAEEFPYFEAGDLVLSLRHLDLVLVVDPDSREVKWHSSHPFLEQHDPDFLEGGWIGIFDNNKDDSFRGKVLGGTRIVALQPHTDSMKVLYPMSRSGRFYTEIMGKWQQLENGNLLLTESRAGRVVEVAPDGRTVWEWINEPYDESMVPEVTGGTRYDLTEEEVASWPCSEGETG